MSDAWQEMDDWCAKKTALLAQKGGEYVMAGGNLNSPKYRTLLGKSQALHQMRSYIHGARKRMAK